MERLASTGTVLGLFAAWECSVGECTLAAGDALIIYTDGITEAFNDSDEEWGEAGLLASVKAHRNLPPQQMIDSILSDVQTYSPHEQHDDMTLVVAKCTG